MPLLQAPVEVHGGAVSTKNVNNYESKAFVERLVDSRDGAAGGVALGGGINSSAMTTEDIHLYNQYNQSGGQVEMDYAGGRMMTGQGHLYSGYRTGAFDGMALSGQFLGEYYSSVST